MTDSNLPYRTNKADRTLQSAEYALELAENLIDDDPKAAGRYFRSAISKLKEYAQDINEMRMADGCERLSRDQIVRDFNNQVTIDHIMNLRDKINDRLGLDMSQGSTRTLQ